MRGLDMPIANCPVFYQNLASGPACTTSGGGIDRHDNALQDGKLYGDGWTPLMAAAVADRHGIAVRLLSAAGAAVDNLVRHANRYGQTAVHIAARKGSLPMLRALLNIGGPAVAVVRCL